MLDLSTFTLEEASLFREITGKRLATIWDTIGAKPCAEHRVMIRHCEECNGEPPKPLCEKHEEQFELCDRCVGWDLPENVMVAFIYLHERREDPKLTVEAVRKTPYLEALDRLGNALRSQGSTPSTSNGSHSFSTSTRGSRRKASKR